MRRLCLLALVSAGLGGTVAAQRPAPDSSILTVDRIFGSPEFRGGSLGSLAWLSDGVGYTTLEPTAGGKGGGQDMVRFDAEAGLNRILVPAARLVPAVDRPPGAIGEEARGAHGGPLLGFTHSQPERQHRA